MDINWADLTYSIYDIQSGALLETVNEQINDSANPWRLAQGAELLASGQLTYQRDLTDADVADYGVIGG